MSTPYITRFRTTLVKIEGTPGVDASPVVGSDAILVENSNITPRLESEDLDLETGTLDDAGSAPAGAENPASYTWVARHSGTAETPPEGGPSLRACAMLQTITSAAITGTCTGTGTTTTAPIEGTDISADDELNGMPFRVTGGTNNGYQGFIIDSVDSGAVVTVTPPAAAPFDATTTYSIDKNVRYSPRSTSTEAATIYNYKHRNDGGNSRLNKTLGARGNWTLTMGVRRSARFAFNFTGKAVAPSDVSHPGAATYGTNSPLPWVGAGAYLNGAATKVNGLTLEMGNNIVAFDDPSDAFGRDIGGVISRRMGGRIVPPKSLLSVLNPFALWQAGTTVSFATWWGPSAGQRIAIVLPAIRIAEVEDQDISGGDYDGIRFRCVTPDQGCYIIFW